LEGTRTEGALVGLTRKKVAERLPEKISR
jgi:hypothetical protein